MGVYIYIYYIALKKMLLWLLSFPRYSKANFPKLSSFFKFGLYSC